MWNDANKILPEKDGDYLVYIRNAEAPCVLSFDADVGVWHDEEDFYNVTHWLPIPPNSKAQLFFNQDDIDFIDANLTNVYCEISKIEGVASVITNPTFTKTICDSLERIEDMLGDVEGTLNELSIRNV